MKYIVRYKTRYWTVPESALQVRFKGRYKKTGMVRGLGPIMERTGSDKSTVEMWSRMREETARGMGGLTGVQDAKGSNTSLSRVSTRLLERHRAIRILPENADEILAEHDQEIEAIRQQLVAARRRRAEAVAELWKKAEKVSITDLEEKANANA